MRVAIFTDTYLPDVNGVARTLGRWVQFLESRGIPCMVFAPDNSEWDASEDSRDVHRYYSIPFVLYPEVRLGIPNPIKVKKSLKEFNPTLIHCATPFNMGLYGKHYAKKHNIPLVASYHTHFDQYLSHYKIQWVESILWKYMLWFHQECRKVYVPSQSTMDYLADKGFENLEIWSRGVETDKYHPVVDRRDVLERFGIPSGRKVVLYVGRIAPEKSVDVALSAFESLDPAVRDGAHLAIVGDGPLYKEFTEANTGPLADRISYLGFQQGKELNQLYAASDVFLFPSATETFGNVVLESLASGTPVVGAAAGGVRDNIRHEETGLLCEPGNVPQFKEAVERLLTNARLRETMGAAGRAYSLEQSWEQIFNRLLESYEEVGQKSFEQYVDLRTYS